MLRSGLLSLVVCAHATCFCGGEMAIERSGQAVNQEPVSIEKVYNRIKKVVPYRSQRFGLLREDDSHFDLLIKDLAKKFGTTLQNAEDVEALKCFCEGEDEQVVRCGAILAKLMKDFKQECAHKAIYRD